MLFDSYYICRGRKPVDAAAHSLESAARAAELVSGD
jgi:hypothetical protein